MKFFLSVVFLAAAASADVSHIVGHGGEDAHAPILKQAIDVGTGGSYQWNFETGNGIVAQEQGSLKNIAPDVNAQVAQGSHQWTAPDGTPIQVSYIADENGYQPQGAHLPTPHPIPDYILRSIEYNAAHPETE